MYHIFSMTTWEEVKRVAKASTCTRRYKYSPKWMSTHLLFVLRAKCGSFSTRVFQQRIWTSQPCFKTCKLA